MATIKSQMLLNDGISGVLKKITSALDTTLAAFEQMQQASGNAVDVANIEAARAELASAGKAVDEMADDYKKAAQEEEKLNENIHQGSAALDGMVGKVLSLVAAYASLSAIKGFAEETMEAADVQINAQVQLRTVLENMGAMDTYDTLVEQIDGAELENNLLLDTSEAAGSYSALEANINNAGLANELILDTAGALDSCENFSKGAGRMDLPNTLFLDTAAASEAYEILADSVDGAELSNALLLDTAAASKAYEMLAGGIDGAELPNTLFLDTAAASEAYEILADSVDGAELSNALVLETAGAENDYSSFLSDVSGGNITVPVQADSTQAVSAYDAILAKASDIQAHGMFGDEAMISGAAELGTYFSDVEAVMTMMDTLTDYAAGMSLGKEVGAEEMVNYATNLGKVMTGSYMAMNQKGFKFSDTQKAIIEGTASQADIVRELGDEYLEMSNDMQAAAVISSVIGEAWDGMYESMSNTPFGLLVQLNNALGDIKENIGAGIYPAVVDFVGVVQSRLPQIGDAAMGLATVLGSIIDAIAHMTDLALTFGAAVSENWGWIGPIVMGAALALGVYLAATKGIAIAQGIAAGVTAAYHAVVNFLSIGFGILTGNTAAASAAVFTFNSALMASPITWVILAIIALIAVIYAVVGAVNHFAGTSVSATGIIAGAFAVLGAYVINKFVVPVWNSFAAIANFIGNVFNDPVAAVKVLFYDMALTVVGYIKNMAEAIEAVINKIPGVTVDITSGLDNFYAGLEKAQQSVKDESGWVEYVGKMEYIDYGDAASAGYKFGQGAEDKIGAFFDNLGYKPGTIQDYADKAMGAGLMGAGPDDPFAMEGLGGDVGDIADNTKAAADSLEVGREELSYLRDIAERDAINRFTTAEVKIDMSGMTNRIDSDLDIDGVIRQLTEGFTEALSTAAEGVHP